MTDFPTGNIATQERFIEAFKGLTQLLTDPRGVMPYFSGRGTPLDRFLRQWEEMFNELRGEEEPDAPAPR